MKATAIAAVEFLILWIPSKGIWKFFKISSFLLGNLINKSHKQIIVGQILTFPYQNDIKVIKVLNLGNRRGPSTEAKLLFEDLSENLAEKKINKTKQVNNIFEKRFEGSGRPTKRDRRLTDKLKLQNS